MNPEQPFDIIVETKEGLHILLGASSNRQYASILADSLWYGDRQHYQAIYVRDMSDPRNPMLMDIWPESYREPEKHKQALERYRKQFGLSIDRKRANSMTEQPLASQDWHTRAIVRILETTKVGNPEGGTCTFHALQELEMVQWGRAGRPVDRSRWWSSIDIDGAYIIKSSKTEIVKILDEVAPIESE